MGKGRALVTILEFDPQVPQWDKRTLICKLNHCTTTAIVFMHTDTWLTSKGRACNWQVGGGEAKLISPSTPLPAEAGITPKTPA